MKEKRTNKVKVAMVMVFTIVALLAFWMPQSGWAVKPPSKTMPTKMMLDDPDKKESPFAGDKGKTPFDHDQHVAKDSCVTCHHTNTKKLTKAVEEEVRKCSECHKADDATTELEGTNEDNKFKGKNAVNSKDAFHGTGSENPNMALAGCINCHKVRDQKPTGCNDCHNGS
jgi:hypothetical protein